MSEVIDIKPEQPPRTIQEIMAEYKDCAEKAGDLHYRVKMFESHIQMLQEKMFKLNEEGDQLEKLNRIKDEPQAPQ